MWVVINIINFGDIIYIIIPVLVRTTYVFMYNSCDNEAILLPDSNCFRKARSESRTQNREVLKAY